MRANSSTGPLARGLSIPLFSHGPARRSCKIKDSPTCMPSPTFEQLLDRAVHARMESTPGSGISGATTTDDAGGRQAGDSARHGGRRAATRSPGSDHWPSAHGASGSALLPPAVVVGESADTLELPFNVPAERWASARISRSAGGGRQRHEVRRATLRELPQTRLGRNGRADVGAQAGYAADRGSRSATTRLPSTVGGRMATCTRYIVTPERAYTTAASRPGRTRRRHRGQPVRRAVGAQLGLRRFPRSARVIDWVAEELEASFVALNPLHAIHNRRPFNTSPYLPNCIFYQNFLYLDVEAMEDFAVCRRAQRSARVRRPCSGDRGTARSRSSWSTSAWRRSNCVSSNCCSCSSSASGAPARRGAREFDVFVTREGDCSKTSPRTARSTSICTGAIPTSGCGPIGRSLISDPHSTRRGPSARNTGAR